MLPLLPLVPALDAGAHWTQLGDLLGAHASTPPPRPGTGRGCPLDTTWRPPRGTCFHSPPSSRHWTRVPTGHNLATSSGHMLPLPPLVPALDAGAHWTQLGDLLGAHAS